ncbi:MAG: FMN-binding protein [Flavobacteriaceae bacterium]|nr:FMN-binding protein [Flavobacteriaceae bacterium]
MVLIEKHRSKLRILNLLIIVLLVLPFLSFELPKHIQKKMDKEIKAVFKIETFELESRTFPEGVTELIPSEFGDSNLYEIKLDSELLGFAYLGEAPSKTDTFDYLILFDQNFVIRKTKVLIYREDYGGEIGSKRWLRQFNGRSTSDALELHKDIMAISGATISVRSMTKAVNDVLRSLKILRQKQML